MQEKERTPLTLSPEHWKKISYIVDRAVTRKQISVRIKQAETFARIFTKGLASARAKGNEASEKESLLNLMFHTETMKLLREKLLEVRRTRH